MGTTNGERRLRRLHLFMDWWMAHRGYPLASVACLFLESGFGIVSHHSGNLAILTPTAEANQQRHYVRPIDRVQIELINPVLSCWDQSN